MIWQHDSISADKTFQLHEKKIQCAILNQSRSNPELFIKIQQQNLLVPDSMGIQSMPFLALMSQSMTKESTWAQSNHRCHWLQCLPS